MRPGLHGGVGIYIQSLLEAISEYEQRHNFFVFVSSSSREYWMYRKWPRHIRFISMNERSILLRATKYFLRFLGKDSQKVDEKWIGSKFDSLKLDVLHFPSTIVNTLKFKTPLILTVFDIQHEYYPEFFSQWVLNYRKKWYEPSVEKARIVIAPTEFTKSTLIDKYRTSPEKIKLIPTGILRSFQIPSVEQINQVRNKYDLPKTFLYYPSNPWQHKNHARLMAALRIYGEKYSDIPHVILSGRLDGETRDSISLAVAAGVEARVKELGFVDQVDMAPLYCAATALIFPSLFEGFGIPLVEAMRCGCPILASETTTIPEITNGAALLFDPYNPREIAYAIRKMIEEPEFRSQLVKNGFNQVKKYDWDNIVPQLFSVYQDTALSTKA